MKAAFRTLLACTACAATVAWAQGNGAIHPKISRQQATATALAAAPGSKVASTELEHEKGADVWSFDLKTPGQRGATEVLVNADTGAIVSRSLESPAKEASEAKAESKQPSRVRQKKRAEDADKSEK